MISEEEQHKRVCSQIDFFISRMGDTFKLFVQLSIATIGGFIWLKTLPNADKAASIFPIIRWILPALAVFATMQILSDFISWWRFRETEAVQLAQPERRPNWFSARLPALWIVSAIFVGFAGFCYLR